MKPYKVKFSIHSSGDMDFGMHPYDDEIIVEVKNGEPGSNPGDFAKYIEELLDNWFQFHDGTNVTIKIEGEPPRPTIY
jgi:hypothetical protein